MMKFFNELKEIIAQELANHKKVSESKWKTLPQSSNDRNEEHGVLYPIEALNSRVTNWKNNQEASRWDRNY